MCPSSSLHSLVSSSKPNGRSNRAGNLKSDVCVVESTGNRNKFKSALVTYRANSLYMKSGEDIREIKELGLRSKRKIILKTLKETGITDKLYEVIFTSLLKMERILAKFVSTYIV